MKYKIKMRPALRYHGGKWMLAPWIISNFPEHRIYVEPFGGAASVLLRKERSYSEIYNELDPEIVNVFKVARDDGDRLQRRLVMTPFARIEFKESYTYTQNPIDKARYTIVKSFMGFGSDSIQNKSGFRANSHRSGTTPAHDWVNYGEAFPFLIERLKGVVIESRDALDVIKQHDNPTTFFYVDPPYLHSTRQSGKRYRFEMTEAEHIQLALVLNRTKGRVMLSGYDSALYRRLYKPSKWRMVKRKALADGARARIEVLWMNYPQRAIDK